MLCYAPPRPETSNEVVVSSYLGGAGRR
jgi:hypothetical protein